MNINIHDVYGYWLVASG